MQATRANWERPAPAAPHSAMVPKKMEKMRVNIVIASEAISVALPVSAAAL